MLISCAAIYYTLNGWPCSYKQKFPTASVCVCYTSLHAYMASALCMTGFKFQISSVRKGMQFMLFGFISLLHECGDP